MNPYASNEELLADGECPESNCIEPEGHAGPHSWQMLTGGVEECWGQVEQTAKKLYPEDTYLSHQDLMAAVRALVLEVHDERCWWCREMGRRCKKGVRLEALGEH